MRSIFCFVSIITLATACGGADPLPGRGAPALVHQPSVRPGCFVPRVFQPSNDDTASLTRSYHRLMASHAVDNYELAIGLILDDPTAGSWSSGESRRGLTASGSGPVSGSSTGTLDIPAQPPGGDASTLVDVELVSQAADTGSFEVRIERTYCFDVTPTRESCDVSIELGTGSYTPELTRMTMYDLSGEWNDHYIMVRWPNVDAPLMHRGCDPATQISFETYVTSGGESGTELKTEMRCWHPDLVEVSCEGVDTTPGI